MLKFGEIPVCTVCGKKIVNEPSLSKENTEKKWEFYHIACYEQQFGSDPELDEIKKHKKSWEPLDDLLKMADKGRNPPKNSEHENTQGENKYTGGWKSNLDIEGSLFEKLDKLFIRSIYALRDSAFSELNNLCNQIYNLIIRSKDKIEEKDSEAFVKLITKVTDIFQIAAGLKMSRGDFQSAITFNEKSMKIYAENHFVAEEAREAMRLGTLYIMKGDRHMGISLMKQSIEVFKRENKRYLQKNTESMIDGITGRTNTPPGVESNREITRLLEKAVKKFEKGKYEKAIPLLIHVKDFQFDYPQNLGAVFNLLGNSYKELGKIEECVSWYLREFQIYEEIDEKNKIAMSLHNLSSSYFELNQYDKALEFAKESKFYNFLMGADQRMVQNLRFIAEIYQKKNQPKKAIETLQEALEFVKIHDSNPKKEFQQMLEKEIRSIKEKKSS